eukprot:scaffold2945_cov244-Pinguiococcus_pyrenoidosus.AAC.15
MQPPDLAKGRIPTFLMASSHTRLPTKPVPPSTSIFFLIAKASLPPDAVATSLRRSADLRRGPPAPPTCGRSQPGRQEGAGEGQRGQEDRHHGVAHDLDWPRAAFPAECVRRQKSLFLREISGSTAVSCKKIYLNIGWLNSAIRFQVRSVPLSSLCLVSHMLGLNSIEVPRAFWRFEPPGAKAPFESAVGFPLAPLSGRSNCA